MTILLVRHAVALRRQDWRRADRIRPLTPRGYEQAQRLPAELAGFAIDRILSSPAVRCVETVEPLAATLGLPVEVRPELDEGAGASAASLVDGLGATVVVCSHGDVIPELFRAVAPHAAAGDGDFACEKGSTWVVEEAGASVRYLPPPA